ncbi:MAG: FAD-dependent oxidoreductase [Planctomycetota bacterium]
MVNFTIDGESYEADAGATILAAAVSNEIYIPALCSHPDLPPFKDLPRAARVYRGDQCYVDEPTPSPEEGCGLCVVEVAGCAEPVRACQTPVESGMSIRSASEQLKQIRRKNLMRILERHPHACLTCAQREGCSLEDCSSNVPKEERCCSKFHDCELRRVAEYIGVKEETPRYRPAGVPVLDDEPLFARDFNLCIDCARCVRICNQVRGVDALGIVHNGGRLIVGSVAPTLLESACKFCGACVEVCPTGCLTDKQAQTGDRQRRLVPCVHACPAGADVPGYIRRIARGDFEGAAALVWEQLPLPNVLGHVCFHDCEIDCRRSQVDEPLAICALKRFALEASADATLSRPAMLPDSGKQVAVGGGGPAGLAAAYFLRLKGHAVTIFEADDSAGGMAALSIPDYRLPREVLDKDLAVIQGLGVEIRTGCSLAGGPAMAELLDQGYDAVLIAVGLPESRRITIAGADLVGVYWGLEFLRDAKRGQRYDLGKNIVVVGGGNVAIDVAMTALRLAQKHNKESAPNVRLFCLESRPDMPAHTHEIAEAEAEGICIDCGWGPANILGEHGKVSSVEFRCCTSVFDTQQNFAPQFDEQQRMTVAADTVILAIGQAPPDGVLPKGEEFFLAGDIAGVTTGGGSVVHAVASGRAAAERIDEYLGGNGDVSLRLGDNTPPSPWLGREEGFAPRPRVPFPCVPPAQRCADFRLIEQSYTADQAVTEAKRCLQCDLRIMIAQTTLPPERWLAFNSSNVDQAPHAEGVLVLAGADKKPTVIKGAADIRAELLERLTPESDVHFFLWEEDRMYTKRESELIQQHLKQYGEMPGGGDDELDDLF